MTDDTRSRILRLAVEAIDAGGEAALRVNEIIVGAGVTAPTLYHYFGSRDGLVIAAQVERYTRRTFTDIHLIGQAVERCATRDDLRNALVTIWAGSLASRARSRWRRTNAFASAYARPELLTAIAAAQDAIVAELERVLEPFRVRGWFREGIDLTSTIAWHHSVLVGRVYIEHGQQLVDSDEWDRLTIDALVHAFFGAQ